MFQNTDISYSQLRLDKEQNEDSRVKQQTVILFLINISTYTYTHSTNGHFPGKLG